MTYVLIEAGQIVRPSDADEAAQWQWERVLDHRARGRYPCLFGDYVQDCPRERNCCQGGPLVVKPRWRRYTVRKAAR